MKLIKKRSIKYGRECSVACVADSGSIMDGSVKTFELLNLDPQVMKFHFVKKVNLIPK